MVRHLRAALVVAGAVLTANPSVNIGASSADPVASLTPVAEVRLPVDLATRVDDDGLYVVQQDGFVVRVVDQAVDVVLDLSDLVEAEYEQGLLGLTFAPGGDLGYVNFTDASDDTVIAELAVSPDGIFDRDTMRTVLTIEQPETNHNGGDLTFGPDGMLYIGMGDGGGFGDPERRAQDRSLLLSKLLRIDPKPSGGLGYTIPDDNPYVRTEGVRGEIWAEGLRNPWRFSFDEVTGDLWIADVGEGAWEEINFAPATNGEDAGRGLNFGWSAYEGNDVVNGDVSVDDHTPPLYAYPHDGRCSVSGGVRARGAGAGTLDGWYVFADYCSGQVFALEVLGEGAELSAGRVVELVGAAVAKPTAIVGGVDGSIYILSETGLSRVEAS